MAQSILYDIIFFDLGETLITSKPGSATTDRKEWMPGAVETLKRLTADGVLLGVISNTGDMTRKQLMDLLPTDFVFDIFHSELIILSSEAEKDNIKPKPSLEIFGFASSCAQKISAGASLYCSENLEETLAAQQVGMNGLRLMPSTAQGGASEISNLVEILQSVTRLKE